MVGLFQASHPMTQILFKAYNQLILFIILKENIPKLH